jgi:serine/threonine protein kinase
MPLLQPATIVVPRHRSRRSERKPSGFQRVAHPGCPAAPLAEDHADPLILGARKRIGDVLRNKWSLDELIGVGGMAAVYAATHRNGNRAAVKILHAGMSANPAIRERFLCEGFVANSVAHLGALQIIDDDVAEDGSLFLVTELLDGETLDERRLRVGGRMTADEVLLVTDQLLAVLAAAHAHGVVHRDVKPENLFLTRVGQLKVLDFGIARMRDRPGPALTQPGAMMGTPSFMAPEHASGLEDEVDERSDIWSCGAMMFTLLSGAFVHEGVTANDQLARAMTNRAAPLRTVAGDVAPSVALVVDRALSFEKEQRWCDASSMRQAVGEAYQELVGAPIGDAAKLNVPNGIDLTSIAPPAPLPVRGRWSTRAALAGATLVIVGVGFAGTRYSHHTNELFAEEQRVAPAPPAEGVGAAVETTEIRIEPIGAAPWEPSTRPSETPTKSVNTLPSTLRPWPSQKWQSSRMQGAPPTTEPARADCFPPYIIDMDTGKKLWKLECL